MSLKHRLLFALYYMGVYRVWNTCKYDTRCMLKINYVCYGLYILSWLVIWTF